MILSRSPLGHIVLVGTSTLRNTISKSNLLASLGFTSDDIRSIVGIVEKCNSNSEECSGDEAAKALDAVTRLTLNYPYDMSAELNGMRPWLEAFKSGDSKALGRVVLLETDTVSGRAAGDVLEGVFKQYGVSVDRETVSRLGIPGFFVEGIKNLLSMIRRVAQDIIEAGQCPLINLTGGFKPESAVALVSSIGYVPLGYYIHESFRDVIYIPLYPLADKSGARSVISRGIDRGEWIGFRDPPEWLTCLASTLVPPGKAAIGREEIQLSHDIIEIIKTLSQ